MNDLTDEVYKFMNAEEWPELTEHSRFSECIKTMEIKGHPDCGLFGYMVPLSLYLDVHHIRYCKEHNL